MSEKENKLNSITKFIWAIVGAIGSILALIFMFKRSNGATGTLMTDDALNDQADDTQADIDELKADIEDIDTSDMSDSDVADYFNNKGK